MSSLHYRDCPISLDTVAHSEEACQYAEIAWHYSGDIVLGYLGAIPFSPGEIAKRVYLPVEIVISGLSNLELRGLARSINGSYIRIR